MTAPRAREQADPPAPPDCPPPRRGGRSSPFIYAVSAAGRAAGPARPAGARRGLVRSARALAVAALLALSGALALPATAQEQTTFVSNLAKAQGSRAGSIQAQSFSTGSHTAGYMLSTVQLLYATKGSAADTSALRVKIRTNSSGAPGGLVADLSNPASFVANTIVSFTAPANTMLDAEETYWVVINEGYDLVSSQRLAFYQTTSDDETTTTADSNWSIGDERLFTNDSSQGWTTSSNSLKIAIIGTAAGGGTPSNNAPVFDPATATRTVAENSAAGTNVGAVIPEATDADNDTLAYSMEGTDAASFEFTASTRQITTKTGVTYNYEATKNSYTVTVTATDGTDSGTITVTINVTDVAEKPDKPDPPTLAAVTGSSTSLTATWTAPGLNDGPAITGYDVGYKVSTANSWTSFTHTGTGVTATITGLTASTSYQVRVLAKNGETDSDWSDASTAVSTNAAGTTPTITTVAITSTPVLETDTYGAGERIEVTVTFSEAVNATEATTFVLSVGGDDTRAPLLFGSGTTRLVFSYTVRASDEDDDGIWIGN